MSDFNDMCSPIFDRCMEVLQEALERAQYSKDEIDEIILVGGSTRIPEVQRRISDFFGNGKELNKTLHPDEAVAIGATILAGRQQGAEEVADVDFIDAIPLSIGLETLNPELENSDDYDEEDNGKEILELVVDRIIERDSEIPVPPKKKEYFTSQAF